MLFYLLSFGLKLKLAAEWLPNKVVCTHFSLKHQQYRLWDQKGLGSKPGFALGHWERYSISPSSCYPHRWEDNTYSQYFLRSINDGRHTGHSKFCPKTAQIKVLGPLSSLSALRDSTQLSKATPTGSLPPRPRLRLRAGSRKDPELAPPTLGARRAWWPRPSAPHAPDLRPPSLPPLSRKRGACEDWAPARRAAQPGTAQALRAAATRGPRRRHRPPGPAPRAEGRLSPLLRWPLRRPLYYDAAVRGPGERRRENCGRDRPGRGLYQVSGRPEGRARGRAPDLAWVLIAGSRSSTSSPGSPTNGDFYYFHRARMRIPRIPGGSQGLTPREAQEVRENCLRRRPGSSRQTERTCWGHPCGGWQRWPRPLLP